MPAAGGAFLAEGYARFPGRQGDPAGAGELLGALGQSQRKSGLGHGLTGTVAPFVDARRESLPAFGAGIPFGETRS